MELLKFKKFDPEAFEKEQNAKREALMNNPDIQKLVNEKQIPIAKVSQLSYFDDYLKSLAKCKNCKGLTMCSQEVEGMRMSLDYEYTLVAVKEYCPYYQKAIAKDAFKKYIVYSDIPRDLEYITFNDIDINEATTNPDRKIVWSALYYILKKKSNQGLYIYGDFGTGKTYMSIALVNSLARANEKVAFVKLTSFVNKMRQLVISDREEYDDILDRLKRVKYLVLDDIGTESLTSFIRDDLLFNLLDYRMENKLLTIFTSNHSMQSLHQSLMYDKNNNKETLKADRLMERIRVLAKEYHLGGQDRRFL